MKPGVPLVFLGWKPWGEKESSWGFFVFSSEGLEASFQIPWSKEYTRTGLKLILPHAHNETS